MSNLDSARSALQAEIEHARQGLSFYQTRIVSLEKALEQLAQIDGVASPGAPVAVAALMKRVRKPKSAGHGNSSGLAPAVVSKRASKHQSKKGATTSDGNELPFTGGDFWQNLITAENKSAKDVLDGAVATLGFTPTKEQLQKLVGRMTFALNALVKSKNISDSGRGRERRFFKE